jgi:hypothetical protein
VVETSPEGGVTSSGVAARSGATALAAFRRPLSSRLVARRTGALAKIGAGSGSSFFLGRPRRGGTGRQKILQPAEPQ